MAKRPATRPTDPDARVASRQRSRRPANPRRPSARSQRTGGQELAPIGKRKRWPLIAALAAAVALVATAAGAIYLTRGAREVTVDQAVDEFRSAPQVEITEETKPQRPSSAAAPGPRSKSASTPTSSTSKSAGAAPAAAPGRNAFVDPQEGVYVYATKGYEETDALAGQRHDYPSETTMTFREGGCGWIAHWQPLKERWEDSEFCETAQGAKMQTYTMYHEFFRRGQTEKFKCDGYVHKKGDKPGDSWTFTCSSPNSTATSKVTVVALETLNVGGRPVKTTHIRYDITAKGANRGKLTQDRWLADSPRAMVKLVQTADLVTESPFGPVGYKEALRLDLKSLEPRR